jgi:hypothetical protein
VWELAALELPIWEDETLKSQGYIPDLLYENVLGWAQESV